jgi:hypothetical protein
LIGDGDGGDGAIEPYQQQQQEEENRVYLAYDGLTSSYTKNPYLYAFDNFIKITVKNNDLRVLLDAMQSVVESKVIDHIKYLNEVKHLDMTEEDAEEFQKKSDQERANTLSKLNEALLTAAENVLNKVDWNKYR